MPVYFIAEEGTERVKIGHGQDPWSRLNNVQTRNDRQLVLMRAIQGDRELEKQAHEQFRALHLEGEWFTYSDEMWSFGKTIDIGKRSKYRPKKQRLGFGPPCKAPWRIAAE
jgi:hypothetical protein